MAKSSSSYYNDYLYYKDSKNTYSTQMNNFSKLKEKCDKQIKYVFNLRESVIERSEEVKKLGEYLKNVSVDGSAYDKGGCDKNFALLKEMYEFLYTLYKTLQKKSEELENSYNTAKSNYNNAKQNMDRSYSNYKSEKYNENKSKKTTTSKENKNSKSSNSNKTSKRSGSSR